MNRGRAAAIAAAAGVVLAALTAAILGISFGGYPLLLPTLFLAVVAALTPRPAGGQQRL